MNVVVNGRFLRAQPVGLHRVARSMLDALVTAAPDYDLDLDVLAPPGVDDPRVTRHCWGPPGRFGDHGWEQLSLPRAAGNRVVLSLANTAPLAVRCSAVVVHDLAPRVGPQWFTRSTRAYGALVLAAARRADLVVTVSATIRGELTAAGIRSDRIAVVKPAVDPLFHPAGPDEVEEVRRRHGLTRPYVLFVGWADPRKDLATALAAHRIVAAETPHDLVLAGRPHPTFRPVDIPDMSTIRRVGYVTDDDLRALLTGAAALLYPSRYEGFGLPPLEAWSCGTPALVSDIPVLRETTQNLGPLLPVGAVDEWAESLRTALRGDLAVPPAPHRTWADAGRELAAVLSARFR